MKVLMITAGMRGGGTERVIAVLANFLAKKKNDVTIIMTSEKEVVYQLDETIKIVSLGESTGGNPIKRLKRITGLRKYFKIDKKQVIMSFGTETNLFTLIASVWLKNKIMISERNDPNQCSYAFFRNLFYRLADNLIFQTEEARLCFPDKIARKGIVIPNPLSEEMTDTFMGVRGKDIVSVGRLEPQKNHKLLLQAFQIFAGRYRDFRLVLYGKGFLLKELQEMARELQIEERVVFAGFTDDVKGKIQDAAMYVLSSDYEGISNSLMEAMALGLPVISTDCPIGGSKMLIQHKENGLLVPVGDANALAQAMEYMVENPVRAESMGEKAAYVKEAYSVARICQNWYDAIGSQ